MTIFCVHETDAFSKRCAQDISSTCIGSKCMAWRYAKTNINDAPGAPMYESDNTYGYCGLAGKPWGHE